jgi:hypothetical protein
MYAYINPIVVIIGDSQPRETELLIAGGTLVGLIVFTS